MAKWLCWGLIYKDFLAFQTCLHKNADISRLAGPIFTNLVPLECWEKFEKIGPANPEILTFLCHHHSFQNFTLYTFTGVRSLQRSASKLCRCVGTRQPAILRPKAKGTEQNWRPDRGLLTNKWTRLVSRKPRTVFLKTWSAVGGEKLPGLGSKRSTKTWKVWSACKPNKTRISCTCRSANGLFVGSVFSSSCRRVAFLSARKLQEWTQSRTSKPQSVLGSFGFVAPMRSMSNCWPNKQILVRWNLCYCRLQSRKKMSCRKKTNTGVQEFSSAWEKETHVQNVPHLRKRCRMHLPLCWLVVLASEISSFFQKVSKQVDNSRMLVSFTCVWSCSCGVDQAWSCHNLCAGSCVCGCLCCCLVKSCFSWRYFCSCYFGRCFCLKGDWSRSCWFHFRLSWSGRRLRWNFLFSCFQVGRQVRLSDGPGGRRLAQRARTGCCILFPICMRVQKLWILCVCTQDATLRRIFWTRSHQTHIGQEVGTFTGAQQSLCSKRLCRGGDSGRICSRGACGGLRYVL